MATVVLVPNSDITIGNWTDEAGGTTDLWAVFDELEASPDTNYLRGPVNAGVTTTLFGLTNITGPFTAATNAFGRIRVSRGSVEGGSAGGDDTHTLSARLTHPTAGVITDNQVILAGTTGFAPTMFNIGWALNSTGQGLTQAEWDDVRLELTGSFNQSMGADGHRLWVDLVNITITYTTPATVEIIGWRLRNDDGDEDGATWKAPQDFPAWNMPLDTNIRIRFRIRETAGNAITDAAFRLRWTNLSGGWINVTTTSTDVRAVASSNVTDGGATTEQLSGGGGTFQAGEISEDGLVDTQSLAANGETELEYVIQYRSADIVIGDRGQALGLSANGSIVNYADGTRSCYTQIGTDVWWAHNQLGGMVEAAGPHVDSSGNLYILASTHDLEHFLNDPVGNANEWFIWKSTDDGSTWEIVGFIPVSWSDGDGRSVGVSNAKITNDILYIAWHEHGSSEQQEVYAAAWDCSTDTLEFGEELVKSGGGISAADCANSLECTIAIDARSDGTVIIFNSIESSSGSAGAELDVLRRTGVATYNTTNIVTDGQPCSVGMYIHTNDDVHLMWNQVSLSFLGVFHRVYRANNTLSTEDQVTATSDQVSPPAKGRIPKAFNRLFVSDRTGGHIRVWYSDSIAEAPTWNSVTLTDSDLDEYGIFRGMYMLDNFGGRVVALWVEESDQQIYFQQWLNGSQTFDTEVATGDTGIVDARTFDFNMFTASTNDVKLGVLNWDTGDVYNLRFFSAGAPVDEGGGAAATFSGWWGFIQGW